MQEEGKQATFSSSNGKHVNHGIETQPQAGPDSGGKRGIIDRLENYVKMQGAAGVGTLRIVKIDSHMRSVKIDSNLM